MYLQIGDLVQIIIKPYHQNIRVMGKIKRILTRKYNHSRGRKVELENGQIGRVVAVFRE